MPHPRSLHSIVLHSIIKAKPTKRSASLTQIARLTMPIALAISLSSCSSVIPQSVAAPMAVAPSEPVVALVLGGGGAKGFAHVGVIKALEANGIHPNLIVGSSVGSVIGSLYASGMSSDDLEQLTLTTPDSALLDYTLSYQGVIEGHRLRQFINTQVNGRPIEALPIRFAAVATQKNTLQKTVFTEGETGLVVQASSSVPGVFIAPRIPENVGIKYIDGGVSSMVPVDVAYGLGADMVIAVDVMSNQVGYETDRNSQNTRGNNTDNSIWSLMNYHFSKDGEYFETPQSNALVTLSDEANRADVVIRPNVANIRTFDTTLRRQAILAGELATNEKMSEIKEALLTMENAIVP